MNAVEIDEAVTALAAAPFDPAEFPYQFLTAFGFKETSIRKQRGKASAASDVPGAVLQRNSIHMAVAAPGGVGATLAALRASPKTASFKAKFVLATDGEMLEAEEMSSGETIACAYDRLGDQLGFFLPLAGISTVKEIKDNPIDVKATGRLNKLYVELLRTNPEWATEAKRPALNQFMARLIFCFFADDTGIFHGSWLFTPTVERMSDSQTGNTHLIVGELFRAMGTPTKDRATGGFRPWTVGFPYVNGQLFTRDGECPVFSKIARAYLLNAGKLNWREINPDIFGSMIQAVADDAERGSLGLHYTSVPNILKVLNPLFLDDLREHLSDAEMDRRKLLALRRRIAAIRVFDPACGSGNFLVIAYLNMRGIEAEIVARLKSEQSSKIRLSNFYGIEIKSFPAEMARLALLIAEFQADCRYIGQAEARSMVLPLHKTGQITVGNALCLDWLEICPVDRQGEAEEHDLAGPTGRLALDKDPNIEFIAPETFICGNPPYLGSTWQSGGQKAEISNLFSKFSHSSSKSLDYVSGWFLSACAYGRLCPKSASAFVSTKSICQGQQVAILWPVIFALGVKIRFAYTSFNWANLATHNAGVTVVMIGLSSFAREVRLFSPAESGDFTERMVSNINPYLIAGDNVIISKSAQPLNQLASMDFGSKPADGGGLLMTATEAEIARAQTSNRSAVEICRFIGSEELINGLARFCLWIGEDARPVEITSPFVQQRIENVRNFRLNSTKEVTRLDAVRPHRFAEVRVRRSKSIMVIPRVSSEFRPFLPVAIIDGLTVIGDRNFAIYDPEAWLLSIVASKLHIVWIATVCARMRTDFSYSNTLGWNTFPVPTLTAEHKADLTRCAETILLTREAHYPATIADLYDPDAMPDDLRRAHDANDETLERIYIGRRFRNDTERLEHLFARYTKMIAAAPPPKPKAKARARRLA